MKVRSDSEKVGFGPQGVTTSLPLIACYGGTFDPVHNGHLQAAQAVCERTACQELRFIPCHIPPHRGSPAAPAAARRAMLELAVAGSVQLQVDARELARQGPSYTIDTLQSLRAEVGDGVALGWVLGADAVAGLDSWKAWRQLPELAHLLLLDRPGYALPQHGPVAELLRPRLTLDVADLHARPAGRVWCVGQRPVAVSATAVRQTLAARRSAAHLLPLPVWAYIKHEGLYGYEPVPGHEAESE